MNLNQNSYTSKVFLFHANYRLYVNAVTSSFKVIILNCTLPITISNVLVLIKSYPEITFRAAEVLSVWKHDTAVYLLQTQDVHNRLKSVSLWTCYCWVLFYWFILFFVVVFKSVCPYWGIAHLRYFWMIRLSVWCHHKCTLSALQIWWRFYHLNTHLVRWDLYSLNHLLKCFIWCTVCLCVGLLIRREWVQGSTHHCSAIINWASDAQRTD